MVMSELLTGFSALACHVLSSTRYISMMSLPHLFKRAFGKLNAPLFSLNALKIYNFTIQNTLELKLGCRIQERKCVKEKVENKTRAEPNFSPGGCQQGAICVLRHTTNKDVEDCRCDMMNRSLVSSNRAR